MVLLLEQPLLLLKQTVVVVRAKYNIIWNLQAKGGQWREGDGSEVEPTCCRIAHILAVAQKGSFQVDVEQEKSSHEGKGQAEGDKEKIVPG